MTEKHDKPKSKDPMKHTPKDAQVIMAIMKEMGITEYEPRVINQLLDFTYRYTTNVLDDARAFALHAKKKNANIDLDDIRLAVHMQLDKSFVSAPPREVLLEVARVKNVTPLPLIKPRCGIRLPPERYCLSANNLRLKPVSKKPASKPSVPTLFNQNQPTQPSQVKPLVTPSSVLQFTSNTKVVVKPAYEDSMCISNTIGMKIEGESLQSAPLKRKRDDDYDNL